MDLRKYIFSDSYDNLSPFSLQKPDFYIFALKNFNNFVRLYPDVELQSLTVKKVYLMLLSEVVLPPRVLKVFPLIDYDKAFRNNAINAINLLSTEGRDVSFRILHRVLPVNEYLYRFKIVRNLKCELCGVGVETLEHLFFHCPIVSPLWQFVELFLTKLTLKKVDIYQHNVLFNIFSRSNVSWHNSVFLVVLAEARWVIWVCRNKNKFKECNVNSNYLRSLFVNNMKLHIKADFKRLLADRFQKLWVNKGAICQIVNNSLVFNF